MARKLSANTVWIYWWLWRCPWASAADIARVTGLKIPAVSNALKRGESELGWFASHRLGRVSPVVSRYVVTNRGLEEIQARFGWEAFWWHAAYGASALARRLEVPEPTPAASKLGLATKPSASCARRTFPRSISTRDLPGIFWCVTGIA